MNASRRFLVHLQGINRRLFDDVSLEATARHVGRSRFELHRTFRRLTGETLKQYTLRVRLERAAGELMATDRPIAVVALASGFASHEVFTRAFRRQFDLAPKQFRLRAKSGTSRTARYKQRALVAAAGPCIRLHRFKTTSPTRRTVVPLQSIARKEIAPLPFLFVRRQASQSELSATLAECFGIVFPHCMKAGLEMAGFPLARYPVVGPLLTVEAGVPLTKPAKPEGEIEYRELPGGPVVFAVHAGPYDQLGDTHAAVLRWIQEHELRVAGPHWEWYVTDPGEHPNPADWRTHLYYPLSSEGPAE